MTGRPTGVIALTILATVLAATFEVPVLSAPAVASPPEGQEKKKPRLSQRRFYTLDPFTVTMMIKGEIGEQFTIVISLELADEDYRTDIAHAVPRLRNEVYNELLHLVTFRRRGAPVPGVALFKQELLKVAKRVVGDKVTALLVQQAFKAPFN